MKVLFNKKVLEHKGNDLESSERLEGFESFYPDTKRKFSDEEVIGFIKSVHDEDYVLNVKEMCDRRDFYLRAEIFLSPESWEAALTSVDLSVQAAEQGSFAVTRPPGHHAALRKDHLNPGMADGEGFCLFNNLAIATQYLLDRGLAKKVAIIDFDAHHGNGTQEIFYSRNDVLYCSCHRHGIYPGTGFERDRGVLEGEGYTLNVPLPAQANNKDFFRAMRLFTERIKDFDPDIIGFSAGFDSFVDDKLIDLRFTLTGYGEAGRLISELGKKVFCVLEGGYHDRIHECIESFVGSLKNKQKK